MTDNCIQMAVEWQTKKKVLTSDPLKLSLRKSNRNPIESKKQCESFLKKNKRVVLV